jgi:hypothetical protein
MVDQPVRTWRAVWIVVVLCWELGSLPPLFVHEAGGTSVHLAAVFLAPLFWQAGPRLRRYFTGDPWAP